MPSIPILVNTKVIKKHTKLCVLEDAALKSLYDQQAEEKEAEMAVPKEAQPRKEAKTLKHLMFIIHITHFAGRVWKASQERIHGGRVEWRRRETRNPESSGN